MPRIRLVLILAPILLLLTVAGCTGSPAHSSSNSHGSPNYGSSNYGSSAGGASSVAPAIGAAPNAAEPAKLDQPPLQQRDIVRTATLDLTVHDVDQAAASTLAATAAAGGRADADDRSGDQAGRHATLVLRVPPDQLTTLLDRVVALGHENSRTDHGQDVTASTADVTARVQELQISVARLQDFLRHSGSITELVALESQLTQRQSDLQSTVAQQRALADQVSLATLTVDFSTATPAANRTRSGPPGFGSALLGSLHGLWLSLRVVAALLGYLAPFLLILLPVSVAVLRYRRRASAQPAQLEV